MAVALPHPPRAGAAAAGQPLPPAGTPMAATALVASLLAGVLLTTAAPAQVADESAGIPPAQAPATEVSVGIDTEIGLLAARDADGSREHYLSATLAPVFAAEPWSGSLRLLCRANQDGRRQEDYDAPGDLLSVIRYLEYSTSPDSQTAGYQVHLGDIDRAELGYGQFVSRYRNTLSLDDPQAGLVVARQDARWELEGLLASLSSSGPYGLRVAGRPFLADSTRRARELAIGITLAGDFGQAARQVSPDRSGLPFFTEQVPSGADTLGLGLAASVLPLTMLGLDAGIPVPTDRIDALEVYGELGHILGLGSGLGLGVQAKSTLGRTHVKVWLEQRLLGPEYIPSYLNSRYEHDRLQITTVTLADSSRVEAVNTKRNQVYARDRTEVGSYVGIDLRHTRHYRLRCTFERSWTRDESGWFEFELRATAPDLPLQVRFLYDRANMDGLADVLTGAAGNGLTRLELAYQVRNHLLFGCRYQQSFEAVERLGRSVGSRKRTRIEPAVIVRR